MKSINHTYQSFGGYVDSLTFDIDQKMPQGETIERMLVFKAVLNFEPVHAGWYREGESEGPRRRQKR